MGTITVSDKAVAEIVIYAANKCEGFAGMSEKSRTGEAVRKVSGNASGVRVLKTKDGIKLDVYIACKYGADAKELTYVVQDQVKDAFLCTGLKINDVIVHINDVRQ